MWGANPGNPETLMLNTDMALAFDIGDDTNVNTMNCRTGGGGQRGNRCPNTATNAANVRDFADNPQVWLSEFANAWIKLQELGYESGTLSYPEGPVVNVEFPVVNAAPNNRRDGERGGVTTIVASGAIVAAVVLVVMAIVCCFRRRKNQKTSTTAKVVLSTPSSVDSVEPGSVVVLASPVPVPGSSAA